MMENKSFILHLVFLSHPELVHDPSGMKHSLPVQKVMYLWSYILLLILNRVIVVPQAQLAHLVWMEIR